MTSMLQDKAAELFEQRFGTPPAETVFAPGRVNLIGEHVDYNDGLVLPTPVAAGTAVAWSFAEGSETTVHASDFDQSDLFDISDPSNPAKVGWKSYVRGMAAQWPGDLPAMRLLITGDLPRGSGLSSSASLCVAVGRAICAATGSKLGAIELAKRAQRTEHEFAGVACGIMDQVAVAAGEPGEALMLDCRDLSYRHLTIPKEWSTLVVNSGVTRGLVDGEYNARRAQCVTAAQKLGVASLRDAKLSMLNNSSLTDLERRRARHVIEEIVRVEHAVSALKARDLTGFGRILAEGHASLRDQFEVTHPQVDSLVDALQGIIGNEGGARMTGAGFGGSVVVVTTHDKADEISRRFARQTMRVD